MSRLLDRASTLRPAGPLTLNGFVGAIWHASTALAHEPQVAGISDTVSVEDMWNAALLAVDPYCGGDRNGAIAAIADGLFPGWRDWEIDVAQVAVREAQALLVWLEGFDPSLN